MYFVYILKSINFRNQIYIGYTTNLEKRLLKHNSGIGAKHTNKFKPWKVETYISFSDKKLALDFEKYLKVGSGNAFLRKRLIGMILI